MPRAIVAFVSVFVGCSPASSPSISSRETSSPAPVRAAPSVEAEGSAELPSSSRPQEPSPDATPLPFTFQRVESTKVTSLALGKAPKIALLAAGEALLFDGSGFTRLPAPETSDPELSVEIFFGRDDQPRLMGFRRSAERANVVPFYRRYKAGRFQPEPAELGPLAGPEGALYGVLGHDDPEVVCRPGSFCLVKRTTGWGRAPAHSEPVSVVLSGDTAWALHRDRIERLERDAWAPLVPERAWDEPCALFVDVEGAPWVVHGNEVTRLTEGRWQSMGSPLHEPRAIWGTVATDVWLVGRGGASHFDGTTWRPVPGVTGPLSLVARSGPSLWLAGEAGVFRGTARKAE
jgi:hypothetical protein